jgi:hypothetical protein
MFLCVIFLMVGLFTADRAVLASDPNLLGWWPLNEGAGDVAHDISGNNYNGTIYNLNGGGILPCSCSAWFNDAERGMVLSFSGNDTAGYIGAYVVVDAGAIIPAMTLDNDFTWAFWAKQATNGTGVNEVILGNRYGASDTLQFCKFTPTNFEYYNNGNISGKINYVDIPACEWLHHTVVKDGAALTYYRFNLNGELVDTGSSITNTTLVALPFYMGGDAAGERWSGWLSDVRIYDQALTYDEVRAIVPEPTTIALLGLGGLALLRRRKKIELIFEGELLKDLVT